MARRYAYARDEIADLSDEECRELLTALLEEVPGTVDSIRGRMGRDRRRYGRDWRSDRDQNNEQRYPEFAGGATARSLICAERTASACPADSGLA